MILILYLKNTLSYYHFLIQQRQNFDMKFFYDLLNFTSGIPIGIPSELQELCRQVLSQLQQHMVSDDKICFGLYTIAADILVRLECSNNTQTINWTENDIVILNQRMKAIRFAIEVEKSVDRSGPSHLYQENMTYEHIKTQI